MIPCESLFQVMSTVAYVKLMCMFARDSDVLLLETFANGIEFFSSGKCPSLLPQKLLIPGFKGQNGSHTSLEVWDLSVFISWLVLNNTLIVWFLFANPSTGNTWVTILWFAMFYPFSNGCNWCIWGCWPFQWCPRAAQEVPHWGGGQQASQGMLKVVT